MRRSLAFRLMAGAAIAVAAAMVGSANLDALHFVPVVDCLGLGEGEVVMGGSDQGTAGIEALDTYWVATFVRAREGYDSRLAQADLPTVRRLAANGLWTTYEKAVADEAGQGKATAAGATVVPRILSVTFSERNMATVRFDVTRPNNKQLTGPMQMRMVATLHYAYGKRLPADIDRLQNPLGFMVASYEARPELTREVYQ